MLDIELSKAGGLQLVGWLEGPTGLVTSDKVEITDDIKTTSPCRMICPGELPPARLQRGPGPHLRAGDRGVRQGEDAGQARQLYLPGKQELLPLTTV